MILIPIPDHIQILDSILIPDPKIERLGQRPQSSNFPDNNIFSRQYESLNSATRAKGETAA